MVDFLRRHWETVQETLNIKNNKDFYGELQTATTKKPIMKNVLAFIRKQQYLQWRKKLFRDALWTDILACVTQATICDYPVLLHLENRDSLTGIIRKHFFKHNCQCHLKRFTKFSNNLSVLHWTREQWQIKKLKWDENVKFIFTVVKDNLPEN